MNIGIKNGWDRYSRDGDWHLKAMKDCGKWTFSFNNKHTAAKLIEAAINSNVCTHGKHTLGDGGAVCLYASGSDIDAHSRVIDFMIDNKLLRLTSAYNYADMHFKFNGQSWNKQFGNPYDGLIKLSDFIDLDTLAFKQNVSVTDLLTFDQYPKSKYISQCNELRPLIDSLEQFSIDQTNKVFMHKLDTTDFNDKLGFIIPFGYRLSKINKSQSQAAFLHATALLIAHFYQTSNHSVIGKLQKRNYPEVNQLFQLLEKFPIRLETPMSVDYNLCDHFQVLYNQYEYQQQFINSVGYLLFLSLYTITEQDFEQLIALIQTRRPS